MSRQNTKDFQGNKTTLYDIVMEDTGYSTFIHINQMYNNKSKLYYKFWSLGDVMYQCRLNYFKK